MRHPSILLPLIVSLAACSSKPSSLPLAQTGNPFLANGGFLLKPNHEGQTQSGDFSGNPAAERFIDRMVQEHGFNRQQLHSVLAQAKRLDRVLRLMDRQAPAPGYRRPSGPNGAWIRYRDKFITPDNVQKGVAFWNQYLDTLQRAQREYGVPPALIVGIIGVETRWGRVLGKTRIIDALATLSFAYPRRAKYFSRELESFLLMARKEGVDPLDLRGSYAGAMGYGQFMPSSIKHYAVDFNGDGHINLWDPVDAIGSVANYFKQHGWRAGETVAVPASGQARGLKIGLKTRYSLASLAAAGLRPQIAINGNPQVSLLRFDMGKSYQYWYGLPNFSVITRYNNSKHYAMAAWQLGQAVRLARGGQPYVLHGEAGPFRKNRAAYPA